MARRSDKIGFVRWWLLVAAGVWKSPWPPQIGASEASAVGHTEDATLLGQTRRIPFLDQPAMYCFEFARIFTGKNERLGEHVALLRVQVFPFGMSSGGLSPHAADRALVHAVAATALHAARDSLARASATAPTSR